MVADVAFLVTPAARVFMQLQVPESQEGPVAGSEAELERERPIHRGEAVAGTQGVRGRQSPSVAFGGGAAGLVLHSRSTDLQTPLAGEQGRGKGDI